PRAFPRKTRLRASSRRRVRQLCRDGAPLRRAPNGCKAVPEKQNERKSRCQSLGNPAGLRGGEGLSLEHPGVFSILRARAGLALCRGRNCGGRLDLCPRSEEHTSELQSRFDLVCRLLLEKKNSHMWYRLRRSA